MSEGRSDHLANEALSLLCEHICDARRLQGGWPEWLPKGRSILA